VLKPGMFARPRVVFSVRDGAVAVPEEALVPQGARQFLFKVVEAPDGRKLARRLEAKLGLRVPGKVEITEGLQPGDVVVTAGQARLAREDGTPVRLIDLAQAGRAPAPGAAAASGAASGAAARGVGTL
jgi:membrane fusion protein (multidrug efflux system)